MIRYVTPNFFEIIIYNSEDTHFFLRVLNYDCCISCIYKRTNSKCGISQKGLCVIFEFNSQKLI